MPHSYSGRPETTEAHGTAPTRQVGARRASWEREMRRLRVITRMLASVLLALALRMLIVGPAMTSALLTAGIAMLLLAAICLTRRGREVEPPGPQAFATGDAERAAGPAKAAAGPRVNGVAPTGAGRDRARAGGRRRRRSLGQRRTGTTRSH